MASKRATPSHRHKCDGNGIIRGTRNVGWFSGFLGSSRNLTTKEWGATDKLDKKVCPYIIEDEATAQKLLYSHIKYQEIPFPSALNTKNVTQKLKPPLVVVPMATRRVTYNTMLPKGKGDGYWVILPVKYIPTLSLSFWLYHRRLVSRHHTSDPILLSSLMFLQVASGLSGRPKRLATLASSVLTKVRLFCN